MWGTTGFGYNIEKIAERDADAPTGSWGMLFDADVVAKFADCGVYMMDEPDEVVPAVLNYIGEDPNSHDTDVIAKVEPVMQAIRPHIRRFHKLGPDQRPRQRRHLPHHGLVGRHAAGPRTAPGRPRTTSRSPM